jgi:hypothetical protein
MNMVKREGRGSPRPYGTRKHDRDAFPDCAPSEAILVPSLREGVRGSVDEGGSDWLTRKAGSVVSGKRINKFFN